MLVNPISYPIVLFTILLIAAADLRADGVSTMYVQSVSAWEAPIGAVCLAQYNADDESYGEEDGFEEFEDPFEEDEGEKGGLKPIPDPLEPINRAIFVFNDRVYYWILKPVSRGYGYVVPEKGRVAVTRFFANITMPIRFVNSVLQLKFEAAAVELARFVVNTTFGIAGFRDPATETWKMPPSLEDTGQTLGYWGLGPGFYITLPFYGPSSMRDGIGRIGDLFLDPTSYYFAGEPLTGVGVEAYEMVNYTSVYIDLYDDMKKASLDPYSFMRDSYHQYRENLVKD